MASMMLIKGTTQAFVSHLNACKVRRQLGTFVRFYHATALSPTKNKLPSPPPLQVRPPRLSSQKKLSPKTRFDVVKPIKHGNLTIIPPRLSRQKAAESFTGIELIFWGTGGGMPTPQRGATSISLRAEGKNWLFDAGEGTQRAMNEATHRVPHGGLGRVFLTHLHGDHVYGLPGLLRVLDRAESVAEPQRAGAQRKKSKRAPGGPAGRGGGEGDDGGELQPLEVCGPPGLYTLICVNLKLTGCQPKRPINVTEFYSEEIARDTIYFAKKSYPDFDMRQVTRRALHPDPDGYWTVVPLGQGKADLGVRAGLVKHTNGMKTFGYVVSEPAAPGRVDAARAAALGLPPGPAYARLVRGEDVPLGDGTGRVLRARDVVGPPLPGRKITIMADTYDATDLVELAKGSDLVVHEATLANMMEQKAVSQGHACPRIAADFANKAQARALVLTHFSPRYAPGGPAGMEAAAAFVKEAAADYKHGPVIAAEDFMVIQVAKRERRKEGGTASPGN